MLLRISRSKASLDSLTLVTSNSVFANDLFLPEADWLFLLQEIHNRQVIPIVGPELVTVPNCSGPRT
jgi:hypothetical protein